MDVLHEPQDDYQQRGSSPRKQIQVEQNISLQQQQSLSIQQSHISSAQSNEQTHSLTPQTSIQEFVNQVSNFTEQTNIDSKKFYNPPPRVTGSQSTDQKLNKKAGNNLIKLNTNTTFSLDKIVQLYQNDKENYKEYKKLRYKDMLYNINDNILVRNQDDPSNDFVGKLRKIIFINQPDEEIIVLVLIQWYYKKHDLPAKKYQQYMECIGENEVFLTKDHFDYTYVDCINGICNIITYDEYDKLSAIPPNTFFVRSSFDMKKNKIIEPPIEDWEKQCICQKPLNPDLLYISCDVCNKWFHVTCVNLTKEQADALNTFYCTICKPTNTRGKK